MNVIALTQIQNILQYAFKWIGIITVLHTFSYGSHQDLMSQPHANAYQKILNTIQILAVKNAHDSKAALKIIEESHTWKSAMQDA